jgi:hypothetical protein
MLNITLVCLHDDTVIEPFHQCTQLGVIFDSEMSFAEHVNTVVCACFYQLRQLRLFDARLHLIAPRRSYMPSSPAGSITATSAAWRLCSCHTSLTSCHEHCCSPDLGLRRFDHITPSMCDELHWLQVRQRVDYKVALLVYKWLHAWSWPRILRRLLYCCDC